MRVLEVFLALCPCVPHAVLHLLELDLISPEVAVFIDSTFDLVCRSRFAAQS